MNKVLKEDYRKALKKMESEEKRKWFKNLEKTIKKSLVANWRNLYNIFGCPNYAEVENDIIYKNCKTIQGSKYEWRFSFKQSIENDFNIPNNEFYERIYLAIECIQGDYIELEASDIIEMAKYL